MNKMKLFKLVFKIRKAKIEESGAVDRLKMAYILKIKKGFLKPLPSCKYVNPLHYYYHYSCSYATVIISANISQKQGNNK